MRWANRWVVSGVLFVVGLLFGYWAWFTFCFLEGALPHGGMW